MSKKAGNVKKSAKKDEKKDFDFDAVLNAIKSIKINHVSIRKAAAANGIPDRSLTRYSQKFDAHVKDINDYKDEQLLEIIRGIASYKIVATAHTVKFFCICVLNNL